MIRRPPRSTSTYTLCPYTTLCRSLPISDPLVVRPHHRVAGLAAERLGERRHVRRRADRAELRRCVRIGVEPHQLRLVADVAAPDPRPAQEEALVAAQAVDHRVGLAAVGRLQRVVGEAQAAQVADVLAQGQLAVDRSEEHTSELQSLMRTSYAVFCLKKKNQSTTNIQII